MVEGRFGAPTILGVPPSLQRTVQIAHKQGRFVPGVSASQAKRSTKSSFHHRAVFRQVVNKQITTDNIRGYWSMAGKDMYWRYGNKGIVVKI